MEARLRPNEVNLFGQRFHVCVSVTYMGLGFILGDALLRWFADGATWLPLVGISIFFAGVLWWAALWWRRKAA